MAETNINAFKAELEVAERELDRAKSRVESLRAIVEDKPEPTEVEAESIEVTTSKKGKK